MTDQAAQDAITLVNALTGAGVGDVETEEKNGLPAASIRPHNSDQVRSAVNVAARHGGRVAVTRRLRPGILALDLSLISSVDPPDERTCLIRVGAGVKVRDVESRAIQAGLSLGHLLPSSQNKTVGAWLAGPTRGERAIPPGRLETAALAIDAVLADGTLYRSKETPRSATGPDLDHMLLGSEGRFGILTRATLRLLPRALVEASAARVVSSAIEAVSVLCNAARNGLDPVEARWDRSRGVVEARFNGIGAAVRARRFGEAPIAGREIIRGHLELAGSWRAWGSISPILPQSFQLVAMSSDGAFGAVDFESPEQADGAATHARAMGLTIVSPRRLRPSPNVGWLGGAAGILQVLESATDPVGAFRR